MMEGYHNTFALHSAFCILKLNLGTKINIATYIRHSSMPCKGMEPAPKRMMQQVFDWVEERLKLSNLPRDVSKDDIKNFLSIKGDCDMDDVEVLNLDSRTAVVICRGEDNIFKGLSCNNSTLDGNRITVERIRKS